jgi:hypothetical protein
MGLRGLAQDASQATQSQIDEAHRRDGVDVRLPGHNSGIQQVGGASGAKNRRLPLHDKNSGRVQKRAKPVNKSKSRKRDNKIVDGVEKMIQITPLEQILKRFLIYIYLQHKY